MLVIQHADLFLHYMGMVLVFADYLVDLALEMVLLGLHFLLIIALKKVDIGFLIVNVLGQAFDVVFKLADLALLVVHSALQIGIAFL